MKAEPKFVIIFLFTEEHECKSKILKDETLLRNQFSDCLTSAYFCFPETARLREQETHLNLFAVITGYSRGGGGLDSRMGKRRQKSNLNYPMQRK